MNDNKNNNKKDFVNVFYNPSWMKYKTPKISSLFNTERVYVKVKENEEVSVTIKLSINRMAVKQMLTDKDYEKLIKGIHLTGKSKLHEGDTWDEQKGTDIAEHRAMEKAYNTIHNMLCNKYTEMQMQLMSITHINVKFMKKRDKQYACANKLGGK